MRKRGIVDEVLASVLTRAEKQPARALCPSPFALALCPSPSALLLPFALSALCPSPSALRPLHAVARLHKLPSTSAHCVCVCVCVALWEGEGLVRSRESSRDRLDGGVRCESLFFNNRK